MCPLFISTPFNVFYRLKSKILKNIETNQIGISSTGHEKKIFLFSLKSLDKNFNKTSKYLKSLPECLCKDSKTPDIFSFSWLQRIGKVKIYLPENVFKNDKNYLKSYSKFFFSLEKKKKKKDQILKTITLGYKKEEKILMASDFYFKIFSKRKEIGIYENQNLKNFLKIYFYKTDLKNLKISTQLKIFFFLINIGISYLFGMF